VIEMKPESKEEYLRLTYRRMANDAKRLLLDKKYQELRRPTDADYEMAYKIAIVLEKGAPYEKADDGPTISELTLALTDEFKEYKGNYNAIPDELYDAKEAQTRRSINLLKKMAINLLKKMAIEAMAEGYGRVYEDPDIVKKEDDRPKIPFYLGCKYSEKVKDEVYFDCLTDSKDQETRYEAIRQFYKTLGFDSTHLEAPGYFTLTEKGAGLVRFTHITKNEVKLIVIC
jgi:hypothetical protein